MLLDPRPTYDRGTIFFHWTTALLVVLLWILGQTSDWYPRGPLQDFSWSTHVALGLLLIVVWVGRIVWRVTSGRRLPGAGSRPLVALASVVHYALYGLIGIVLALGVANALARGYHVYGIFTFPQAIDKAYKHQINEWHEWGANILLFVAAGHAAMALVHQFGWRDGLLTRMWPALGGRA